VTQTSTLVYRQLATPKQKKLGNWREKKSTNNDEEDDDNAPTKVFCWRRVWLVINSIYLLTYFTIWHV